MQQGEEIAMGDDRRLVYSTEQGALAKPMQTGKKQRKRAQNNKPAVRSSKQGVRIRRESKGRGGKVVSIIDGLPLDAQALKALLKTLKSQLGTGGAIKDGQLEIQGDHREKILQILEKAGHPAKIAGG